MISFDNSAKGYDVSYPALPDWISLSPFGGNALVKKLLVMVPSWGTMCTANFRNLLASLPYASMQFSTATCMMVILAQDDRAPPRNASGMDQGVISFAASLLRLAPTATSISMYFCTPSVKSQKN
ncbi:hypothetical protein IWW38_004414, partial [Coemansia aciculifera]